MNETSRVFWTLLPFKIKIKIKGLKNSSFEDGVSTSKQQVSPPAGDRFIHSVNKQKEQIKQVQPL
jgi:hypothetical protein